ISPSAGTPPHSTPAPGIGVSRAPGTGRERDRLASCAQPFRFEMTLEPVNPLENPAHDGNRDRVADGLVARAVLRRFAAVSDRRVVVGKALQALALDGEEAAHSGCNQSVRFIASS